MCAIFGSHNLDKAAELTALGLQAQQHRATDAAGIITQDAASNFFRYAKPGIVDKVFDTEILDGLFGRYGLGHLRYSTKEDDPRKDNTQPILDGNVAIAHNGNITNTKQLTRALEREVKRRPLFRTSMDTEILVKRYLRSKARDPLGKVLDMLRGVEGSYSLLLLTKNTMIAIRDPWGNRPLWMGKRNGGTVFASESVAFDNIGEVTEAREVLPGEIVVVYPNSTVKSFFFNGKALVKQDSQHHPQRQCVFELEYYSHPASTIFGIPVAIFRKMVGQKLQQASPSPAKQVLAVPDSAAFFGIGYGNTPAHTYDLGITRSHYVGRSFIEAMQVLRINKASRKFTVVKSIVEKYVTLIDDSIVRLTTLPPVVKLLRAAGVVGIHVRIGTPPIIAPCYYGIDTPKRAELIAARKSAAEIAKQCEVESLEFLSLADLKETIQRVGGDPKKFCFACLTGKYDIPISDYSKRN